MPNEILIVDLSELTDLSRLCRVCLTESSEMESLYTPLQVIYEDDVKLVVDALHKFTSETIPPDLKYPSYICPICLDLLNVAYKLHIQLEVSRHQLSSYFECEVVSDTNSKVAPVEVISSHGKYSLQDLIIVEDKKLESEANYEGFLKNLGSEITADFTNENVSTSKPVMPEVFSVNVIPINNVLEDDKCKSDIDESQITETHEDKGDDVEEIKHVRRKRRKNEQLKCNLCDKTFSLKRNLNRHKSEMHPEKNYLCQVCGHVAKSKSSLYNHFMLKHLEKRFECDICGKKYITKSHLRCHKQVHKNERLHLCTVCGKSFNYANALEYHMRTHTGEKKYKCTYCDRGFSMRCGLNRHLRTHTGLRPYKCNYCDKAFRSKGEVDCHEMSHTGYRPYWCTSCKKGFTKMYNLKMHMMGHSGPHSCDFCKRGFLEVEYLKMHMKTNHGLEEYGISLDNIFMSDDENFTVLMDGIIYDTL